MSTSSIHKRSLFESKGFKSSLIVLNPQLLGDYEAFFQSDLIIILLPFRRNLLDPRFYFNQILSITTLIPKNIPIIFTSSTSIYPNDGASYDEESSLVLKDMRSIVLQKTEQLLAKLSSKLTILRLGGLVGAERSFLHTLKKRKHWLNPNATVNLIYYQDVIYIIERLIKGGYSGVYNLVSTQHPTRKILYSEKAKEANRKLPIFQVSRKDSVGKFVSNERIKKLLSYSFIYDDPIKIPVDL